jgi:hypothetical protein
MTSRVGFSFAILLAFLSGLLIVAPIAKAGADAQSINLCKSRASACVVGDNTKPGAGVAGVSKGVGVAGFGGATPAPGAGAVGLGVYGQGAANGVIGVGGTGVGVTGISGTPPSGSGSSGYGVFGVGPNAGVFGGSAVYGVNALSTGTTATSAAVAAAAFSGAALYSGSNGTSSYAVLGNGDIHTTGKVFTGGTTCATGCSVHRGVESYAATAALPTLEDTGEAQLHAGVAYVRLSPDFANAIDPHLGYFVLVTPEDATAGVFVTHRTIVGFWVRENPGGHSSAPFAYRIVAHPYGDRSARLPFRSWSPITIQH